MEKIPGDVEKFKSKKMQNDEELVLYGRGYIGEMMGKGDKAQHNGVLILTNKRVVFYSKSWISEYFEEIQWSKISSVERKTLLGHSVLKIHTSGNSLEFKSLLPKEVEQLEKTINQMKGGSLDEAVITSQMSDPLDLIKRLKAMKEDGLISDSEFESKKQELLKKIG